MMGVLKGEKRILWIHAHCFKPKRWIRNPIFLWTWAVRAHLNGKKFLSRSGKLLLKKYYIEVLFPNSNIYRIFKILM